MRVTFLAPLGQTKDWFGPAPRKHLGALFADHGPTAVCINGDFREDWQSYSPQDSDHISVQVQAQGIDPISILVGVLVSAALSGISALLAPRPKEPNRERSQPAAAVAGVNNTAAPGTPRFYVAGKRRVLGHIIGTRVYLEDERTMRFQRLDFMGRGPIESLSEVQVDDSPIENIADWTYDVRLGTDSQETFDDFLDSHEAYEVGKQLLRGDPAKTEAGEPILYTTQGQVADLFTFFFDFSSGFKKSGGKGSEFQIRIERKRTSEDAGSFQEIAGSPFIYSGNTSNRVFRELQHYVPDPDSWDFRFTLISTPNNTASADPVLAIVQETRFITTNYAGDALLLTSGIGSSQVRGLDQLKISALEEGIHMEDWDGSAFVERFTRKRAWFLRHLIRNRLGMEVDEESFLAAQDYWDEMVPGYDGDELRDSCDVMINEDKELWDWVKLICAEGRASIFPTTGGKWKLGVRRPQTEFPQHYSHPGNVVPDSVQRQFGREDLPFNTIKATFPDASRNYKETPAKWTYPEELTEQERAENMALVSIVRRSQVARELIIRLNEENLITRTYSWQSPKDALVNEPEDAVSLSYSSYSGARRYTGLVQAAGTVTELYLDQQIELEDGTTYSLVLRHTETGEVERRAVANTAGKYHTIQPTADFDAAPAPGDFWAVGKAGEETAFVVIDNVAFGEGMTFDIRAREYVDAVFDQPDPLPDPVVEQVDVSDRVPRPLIYAQAIEINAYGGVVDWQFDGVPGFDYLAGEAQGGGADYIDLATTEPAIDDFFVGTAITQQGETKRCTAYVGATRRATVESAWDTEPELATAYQIKWPRPAGQFEMLVESGPSASGPWTELDTVEDTRLIVENQGPSSTDYFRFTPISVAGNPNEDGRWIVQLVSPGDVTAPAQPMDLTLEGDEDEPELRDVTATIVLGAPVERDAKEVELEWYREELGPVYTLLATQIIPLARDESQVGEITIIRVKSFPMEEDAIWARARVCDYIDNCSDWTDAPSSVDLPELPS